MKLWTVTVRAVCLAGVLACLLPGLLLAQENPNANRPQSYRAEIVEVLEEGMVTVGPVTQPFQRLLVEIKSGDREGERVEISVGMIELNATDERYEVGDGVYVTFTPAAAEGQREYWVITDRIRTAPLAVLAALFSVAIILLGKWKGVRSLLGMALTFVVIIWFMIPRILDGYNPILISIGAAFVIFSVTLFLVHGISRMTAAAVTGTTISLIITGILATVFVGVSHLTGLASEEAALVQVAAGGALNAQGLLLGGIIIGALGVLDDITVSQSSMIFELRRANPALGARTLFESGVRVGRDHIAATVNTLVLAYVGAALPLMILFSQSNQPLLQIINREIVAEEIVRTMVGSLGLISAVPLTTAIASWLAVRTSPEAIERGGDGHHHHHH